MSIFGDKLRRLREENGLSQEELGAKLGTSRQVISRYETSQRSPKISVVVRLAAALGVPLDYFNEENSVAHAIKNADSILQIETYKLPLLGDIACGKPIYADEDFESYIEVSTDISADFALRAKGDSMTGARIYDGDIVFVRQQPTVDSGDIAVVIIDDEATLKRVYWLRDGSIELRAENPSYPPIHVGGENEYRSIHILGKAIAFQGDIV